MISNRQSYGRIIAVAALLFFSLHPFFGSIAEACSCRPYDNLSLCQLGTEADDGLRSNFLAVVRLTDSTMVGNDVWFTVNILELLGGSIPAGGVILQKFGAGLCSEGTAFTREGARGVLSSNLIDGKASPDFCTLQQSFFRMEGDTVFVPLFDRSSRQYEQAYSLDEFRMNACENFSSNNEILPAENAFSLAYNPQNEKLDIIALDPSLGAEKLSVNIYASSGQHLLEVKPSGPIDVSSMPPGMYAILLRDEQRVWSKAFVKPN